MKTETAAIMAEAILDLPEEYQGHVNAAVSRVAQRILVGVIGAMEADSQEHEFYLAAKAGHAAWWRLTTPPDELDSPPPPKLKADQVGAIARQLNRRTIDRILEQATTPPAQWRKK